MNLFKNFHKENFSVRWLHWWTLRKHVWKNLMLLLYKLFQKIKERILPNWFFCSQFCSDTKSRKTYYTNILHQGDTPITSINRHANLLNKMLATPSQRYRIIYQNQVEFIPKCLVGLIFWNQPIKKLKENYIIIPIDKEKLFDKTNIHTWETLLAN